MKLQLVAAMILIAGPCNAATLSLVCDGQGTKPQVETTTANVYGPNGSASGTASTFRTGIIPVQVRVEITDDGGRIRLPASFVPPIHTGDDNGWWPIKDFRADSRVISGKVSLNLFNRPKLTIDRMTGDIELRGLGYFTGVCRKDESADVPKF